MDLIETKSQKVTHSSRVCVRHFNPEDIKMSNKHRSVLVQNAVPVSNEHIILSESESEVEEEEETDEELEQEELMEPEHTQTELITNAHEDFIEEEEILFTFEDFSAKVDEKQDNIAENWNIYSHPNAICFYRLANVEENFNNLNITYKIIVSNDMRVKLFDGDAEASCKELTWAMTSPYLQNFEQFEEILDYYRQEPEILHKKTPMKNLHKAFDLLDHVTIEELQQDIEQAKLLLNMIIDNAQQLGQTDEEEEEREEHIFKEEQTIETTEDQIIDDGTHFDEPMDGMEEIVVDVAQKTKIDSKEPRKCQNCKIVCLSDTGYEAHLKTCNNPIVGIDSIKKEKKSKKHIKEESFESTKSYTRKFGTLKNPKLHPW